MVKKLYGLMNSYSGMKSGSDLMLINLIKRIKKYHSIIITSEQGKKLCNSLQLNSKILISSREQKINNIYYTYIARTWNAFKYLSEVENSIILSSTDFFPDVIPAFLKKKNNIWIQMVYHMYPHYLKREGNFIRNIIGYYAQRISFILIRLRADRIIVLNTQVKQSLIQAGIEEEKIYVCYSGIDIASYSKIKSNKNKFDAICIGRLVASKGIFQLISIWSQIVKKKKNATLCIVGSGPLEQKIQEYVNKKRLKKNVIIRKNVDINESYILLGSSRLFLSTSHEEGFGMAIAEALACGVPAITWDLPVYKEIFGNYTLQIKENNIDAFTRAIVELLDDRQKREAMAYKGKKYIRKYDWTYIMPRFLRVTSGT